MCQHGCSSRYMFIRKTLGLHPLSSWNNSSEHGCDNDVNVIIRCGEISGIIIGREAIGIMCCHWDCFQLGDHIPQSSNWKIVLLLEGSRQLVTDSMAWQPALQPTGQR